MTTITLVLDEILQPQDAARVRMLLNDALAEFVNARTPVDDYVARRYADQDANFRANKADEILARNELAHKIRHAELDVLVRYTERT